MDGLPSKKPMKPNENRTLATVTYYASEQAFVITAGLEVAAYQSAFGLQAYRRHRQGRSMP